MEDVVGWVEAATLDRVVDRLGLAADTCRNDGIELERGDDPESAIEAIRPVAEAVCTRHDPGDKANGWATHGRQT
jgi:hypothetical protein